MFRTPIPPPNRLGGIALILLLAAPGLTAAGEGKITPEQLAQDALPVEQVKEHVAKLAAMGSRVPGMPGHAQARAYLIEQLRGMGYAIAVEGPGADDDLLPRQTLQAAAETPAGQPFAQQIQPPAPDIGAVFNLRVTVHDEDKSFAGGKVSVVGTDAGGNPLREEIVLPKSLNKKAEAPGNKPFASVTSLTVHSCTGLSPGSDAIEVGYGRRFAVGAQRFWGIAPFDDGNGKLTFLAPPAEGAPTEYALFSVWPNGAALSHTGGDRIEARVYYAGTGEPRDYEGLPVGPSGEKGEQEPFLVLLDLPGVEDESIGTRWTLAASLGAQGAIFIEPEKALRPNLEQLFLSTPVEFPRFWLRREEGVQLREALKQAQQQKRYPIGQARVQVRWSNEQWQNLFLLVPGSGDVKMNMKGAEKLKEALEALQPASPEGTQAREASLALAGKKKAPLGELLGHLEALQSALAAAETADSTLDASIKEYRAELESTMVLASYYDSSSVIPALAPGAEQALGCAALLELARQYRSRPPPRDTLLLFADGHGQGLRGEREFFAEVSELPESVRDLELARAWGESLIHEELLQGILEGDAPVQERLNREKLFQLAEAGMQAFHEDPRRPEVEDVLQREMAKKSGISLRGLLAGIVLLLLGLLQNVSDPGRRTLLAKLFGGAGAFAVVVWATGSLSGASRAPGAWQGMVLAAALPMLAGALLLLLRSQTMRVIACAALVFGAVIPLVFQVLLPSVSSLFPESTEVAHAGARIDGLLNIWKEEGATRESDLERRARVMRLELERKGLIDRTATDPARRSTPQIDALVAQRKQFETISRLLYSLSKAGEGVRPPPAEELAPLDEALRQTGAQVLKRLQRERDWCAEELDRRKANRTLRELVQSRLTRTAEDKTGRKTLFFALDFSTGHAGLGLFYKAHMYGQPGDIESRYKGFWGRKVMPIARAVEEAAGGKPAQLVPDTLLETESRRWDTYLGCETAMASEIAIQAQLRGLTLATPYDRRLFWDTPQDDGSAGRLDWDHAATQLTLAGPFLRHLMAEGDITQQSRFEKSMKYTGLSQVVFSCVRRGGAQSIFPRIPLPGTIVQSCTDKRTIAGVRVALTDAANPLGKARLIGVRQRSKWSFEILRPDPLTLDIAFALNKPQHRLDENTSFNVQISQAHREDQVELFRAQGLGVVDVIDPRFLVPLKKCTLLAGQTESQPHFFGTSHPYTNEAHRVLYAEPGTRIKCLFREGELGVRLTLLGVEDKTYHALMDPQRSPKVSAADARGPGIQLGAQRVLPWMNRQTARDLWCLGENRLQELRSHSIGNRKLDNPEYPGPFSKGTVAVTQGSKIVKRSVQAAPGEAWTEQVIRLPFMVHGHPERYEVERLEGAGTLVLKSAYSGPTETAAKFTLTEEDPGLHNLAQLRLKDAEEEEGSGNVSLALQRYTEAWGLEARAYPEVLGTANDTVKGVVFYLFLLLPFCFVLERLIFASKTIERQIGVFFAIFVSMFVLLWMVHPAFNLVAAPPIILLSFVILSLAGVVIAIVYSKFNAEMRMMQQGVQGVQAADVNRASAGLVAVTLGISQMRRRKTRTFLTCLTVVLLTFTALSFTSMVPGLSQAHFDLSPGSERDAPYQGIMLRQLNYESLRVEAYDQFRREMSAYRLPVAPRFWKVSTEKDRIVIDLINEEGAIFQANSMLGLSAQERLIFGPERIDPDPSDPSRVLKAGSWIAEGDSDAALLSTHLAKLLRPRSIAEADWKPQDAIGQKLRLGSYELTVKGVFDSDAFNALKDLDDEPLAPADFSESTASRGAEQQAVKDVGVEGLEAAASTKYQHVDSQQTVILPWTLSVLLGADLRAVAVRIDDPKLLEYQVDRLLKRIQKNLYVGKNGRRQLYASTPKTSLAGLGNLVVPLLISVLILLNVMAGAVHERQREITIFSALGLAPSHISALFLAEAIVYATLGAILGYLLGQGAAKFVQEFGQELGIGGLYLNYSSSSAVFVTAIVMFAVIASTIYPAIMAARAASPSEERSWGVPEPKGDEIGLELPFSFQRDLVPGAALFLYEYFDSHAESSLGKFTAKEVTLEAFHTERGQGVCLFFIAWLSPYDLGVSQEVQIYIVPTAEGLYITEASFFRISGYVTSWQRVNLPFLNALRKHLLLWRTLSPQQRHEYSLRGFYQFQEAFEAVGWPPPEGLELPVRDELDRAPDDDDEPETQTQSQEAVAPSASESAESADSAKPEEPKSAPE